MAEKENDPPFDAGAFVFHAPAGTEAPLLIDSPHSGRCYPENFHTLVPHQVMRGAEDWMVADTFGAAPLEGPSRRAARLPRAYIDPHPRPEDITPGRLDG